MYLDVPIYQGACLHDTFDDQSDHTQTHHFKTRAAHMSSYARVTKRSRNRHFSNNLIITTKEKLFFIEIFILPLTSTACVDDTK